MLGTLPGIEPNAQPADINNRDQIVGFSGDQDQTRAVLWESGLIADLGTLGGLSAKGDVDQ